MLQHVIHVQCTMYRHFFFYFFFRELDLHVHDFMTRWPIRVGTDSVWLHTIYKILNVIDSEIDTVYCM